jgi:hypothetical protein
VIAICGATSAYGSQDEGKVTRFSIAVAALENAAGVEPLVRSNARSQSGTRSECIACPD